MSKPTNLGIESNPVLFSDGVAIPPNHNGQTTDPQNLWFSIERAQQWAALRILGQTVDGVALDQPFIEPKPFEDVAIKITEADEQRQGTDRYTTMRNAESLAAFLGVNKKKLVNEVARKTVLDVGSGDGHVADDFRRAARSRVIELDFSSAALMSGTPIFKNRGSRVVGNGTILPFADASFDNVISLFSTSVHADTVRSRLQGFTEAIRVTRPGGRVFKAPIFGNMTIRQQRWAVLEQTDSGEGLDLTDQEINDYRQIERQQSAIDYALFGLLRELMKKELISLTPVLKFEIEGKHKKDIISGIIDVNQGITANDARDLIEAQAETFSKV